MADLFDVIADPTRRELLHTLLERRSGSESGSSTGSVGAGPGEMGVGELVEKLTLSQPTVSKHLKVLREANLVTVREVGQRRYYRLDPAPLAQLEGFLAPFRSGVPAQTTAPDADGAGARAEAIHDGALDSAATEHADDSLAVFAAWSGAHLPGPLRRAAESLEHTEEAGTAIGRAAADASFRTRSAIDGATSGVRERVIAPLAKRIGK